MGIRVASPIDPNEYKPSGHAPTARAPSSLTASADGNSLRKAVGTSRTDGEAGKPKMICRRPTEANHKAAADPRGLIAIRSGLAAAPGKGEASLATTSKTTPVLESEAIAYSCLGETATRANSRP